MRALVVFFLKGLLIGLAAITPGLTAATTAFILGSYSQILQAIKSLNFTAIHSLFRRKLRELGESVQWKLLLSMPLGAACAIFLLPQFLPLSTWQEQYQPLIYAGFCGMIFGGLCFTLSSHRGGGLLGLLLFFGGIAASITLLLLPIQPLPGNWIYLFLHGILAVITQAIPGLASCFAERPLVDYAAVAYYTDHGFWPAPLLFGLGLLMGIALLVNLFAFFWRKAPEKTLSLFMGLTAGVLLQLWPLRYLKGNGEEELLHIGIALIIGIALSGLLQFLQRRTLA